MPPFLNEIAHLARSISNLGAKDSTVAKASALSGVALEVEYAEEHLHHKVRWFGKLNPQDATHWAVSMQDHLAQPYRAISGNGVYGADPGDEAQLFGTADIPIAGMVRGDFDEILITANSSNTVYLCRLVWGTGILADAVALGQYTEFPFFRAAADQVRKVMIIPCEKVPIQIGGLDVKIWIQCQNVTDNATIDFFLGVHGYPF